MECLQCGTQLTGGTTKCEGCGAPVLSYDVPYAGDTVKALFADAANFFLRQEFGEAIGACTRILQRDPTNAAAHALLGDIYREQKNYQEALGWYKLAVRLTPENDAYQKSLDEMISRVLPASQQQLPAATPKRPAATPKRPAAAPKRPAADRAPAPGFGVTLKRLLTKVQPVHVVIGFSALAMLVALGVAVRTQPSNGQAKSSATINNLQQVGMPHNLHANSSAVIATPVQPGQLISPPPPDKVEGGGTTPAPLPTPQFGATPAPEMQPIVPTTTEQTPSTQVQPYPVISTQAPLTSEEVELQTTQLRTALDRAVTESKLPGTVLNDVSIDPRTRGVTLVFTIPAMPGPVQTKQGLIYAAFSLIWAAYRQNDKLAPFTVRGNAPPASGKPATLALTTEVTAQQAVDASRTSNYQDALACMTNPWWRADLTNVGLTAADTAPAATAGT